MSIENGWIVDEKNRKPHKVGACDNCGRMVYDDEDYENNGETLLCLDCSMYLSGELTEQVDDFEDKEE